jgi:hypothetical protein
MKKSLQENTYSQLVKDITSLYDCARRALPMRFRSQLRN